MHLIFFGDRWDNSWRRRQSLAYQFSLHPEVRHVYYIEQPINLGSVFKFLIGKANYEAARRIKRTILNRRLSFHYTNTITVITPLTLFPLSRYRLLYRLEQSIRSFLFRKILNRLYQEKDVIYISFPYMPRAVMSQRANPQVAFWYDCTEDFSTLAIFPDNVRKDIIANNDYFVKQAHIVTGVSVTLVEKYKELNRHTYLLPNAVDSGEYYKDIYAKPETYMRNKNKRVLFIGGGAYRQDWEIIDYIVEKMPEVNFYFIGFGRAVKQLALRYQSYPHVVFIPWLEKEELSNYLYYADVCIQLYRNCYMNDTSDAQKLYLYLAFGKPVVSTPTAGAQAFAGYIYIAGDTVSFKEALDKALQESDTGKQESRKKFIAEHSWVKRAEQAWELLRNQALA